VPRDAESRVRIRFEHTVFPHWGTRSGYVQLPRSLDPTLFMTALHGASDNDSDLPRWLYPVKPMLREICRRSAMPWYKPSDLVAEARISKECWDGQWDIVHFLDGEHSGYYLPRLLRLARISDVRIIATFHQPPDVAARILRGPELRQFDQVILVSPSQKEFFGQYVDEDRLHVILHGVDTSFFITGTKAPGKGRMRCITVGNWLRDWHTFERVVGKLPDMDFDVVSGQSAAPRFPNVIVHSGLDDSRLAALYRTADVLFLPLLGATANNALLEGIASGLPVVSTDLEAVRAYLPGGEGILVSRGAEGYVDALRKLQRDDSLRSTMSRLARTRAEELSWPHVAALHARLYNQALCRPAQA
jgi:glycosyltransferase involved in cell wall biosynthesis